MAQHFLLSRAAKTLTLGQVYKMTDAEAETAFRNMRWPDTNGEPTCPACGNTKVWDCRRANGSPRFRCTACRKSFSITSGSLFDSHKLPLRGYLAAVAVFCNEVKGKSALALSLGPVLQVGIRPATQIARSNGGRDERPRYRWRGQGCGNRRGLFRRLHQADQSR